jgi:DNA-directed RNA polymerase subunit M/transcription elongation factor TFIIS
MDFKEPRIHSYKSILQLCDRDYRVATILEGNCWQQSVRAGSLHGIPIWQYSTGSNLFETDKLEMHERELMASYIDAIEEIKSKLMIPEAKKAILKNPETSEDFESFTAYGEWRKKYFDGIATAKKVLEEKVDESSFIQCKMCKSYAVDTEQKQTRSADEPMTIFCSCRKCGKRFRID